MDVVCCIWIAFTMSVAAEIVNLHDMKLISRAVAGEDVLVSNFILKRYAEEKIGYLGVHQRLEIQVKCVRDGDETNEEIVCFVKALPLDNAPQLKYIQESRAFDKEVAFYNDIVPQLMDNYSGPVWCPRCYLTKDCALCFEDLACHGFKMQDKLFDEMHLKSALRAVASFHASSIRAEAKFGRPLNEVYSKSLYEMMFVKDRSIYKWFTAGMNLVVSLAEKMGLDSSRLPDTTDKLYQSIMRSDTKVNVINHGDLWSNNILFDDKLQCRLVDFQIFRYCPIGCDLAQLLYLCAPNELRRTKDKQLLRYYYDFLVEYLGDKCSMAPSFDEVFQSYKERRITGCITAAMYFPTILMDGFLGRDILDNPETFEQFCIVDRRVAVMDYMDKDPIYKVRIESAVEELVEMSIVLDQLPIPC